SQSDCLVHLVARRFARLGTHQFRQRGLIHGTWIGRDRIAAKRNGPVPIPAVDLDLTKAPCRAHEPWGSDPHDLEPGGRSIQVFTIGGDPRLREQVDRRWVMCSGLRGECALEFSVLPWQRRVECGMGP
ncbi:MAG TPA: hypothetical protein VN894_03875, partial [Polyangiaceae bacterium]|nr:hypothetical protein [Polyangiaceae bacterium]